MCYSSPSFAHSLSPPPSVPAQLLNNNPSEPNPTPPGKRREGAPPLLLPWTVGGVGEPGEREEGKKEREGERGGEKREAAAVSEACNVLLHCALQLNAYVHALNVSHSASLPTYRQFRNFALWFDKMPKARDVFYRLPPHGIFLSSFPASPFLPFGGKNPKKGRQQQA